MVWIIIRWRGQRFSIDQQLKQKKCMVWDNRLTIGALFQTVSPGRSHLHVKKCLSSIQTDSNEMIGLEQLSINKMNHYCYCQIRFILLHGFWSRLSSIFSCDYRRRSYRSNLRNSVLAYFCFSSIFARRNRLDYPDALHENALFFPPNGKVAVCPY